MTQQGALKWNDIAVWDKLPVDGSRFFAISWLAVRVSVTLFQRQNAVFTATTWLRWAQGLSKAGKMLKMRRTYGLAAAGALVLAQQC